MKLSIITINRNNAAGLKKTMQSVALQTYTDFEYIVIDGASDDGSVDVIKTYTDNITYWVSEPDTGIYNAMNKGIRKAHGDYCLFLNSGDWLIEPETLQKVFKEIAEIQDADVYYSDALFDNETICTFSGVLTIHRLIEGGLYHQNVLTKKELFDNHGFYNEGLQLFSDWEFYLKEFWIYKSVFIHLKNRIAIVEANGLSSRAPVSEYTAVYNAVFGEFARYIIDSQIAYHRSIYGDIIENYGSTKLLVFFLRIYRFFLKRILKVYHFFIKRKGS